MAFDICILYEFWIVFQSVNCLLPNIVIIECTDQSFFLHPHYLLFAVNMLVLFSKLHFCLSYICWSIVFRQMPPGNRSQRGPHQMTLRVKYGLLMLVEASLVATTATGMSFCVLASIFNYLLWKRGIFSCALNLFAVLASTNTDKLWTNRRVIGIESTLLLSRMIICGLCVSVLSEIVSPFAVDRITRLSSPFDWPSRPVLQSVHLSQFAKAILKCLLRLVCLCLQFVSQLLYFP